MVSLSNARYACAQEGISSSGASYKESDLYAPVLKSTEALALAAANGAKVVKTDTMQAYLSGDMGDDVDIIIIMLVY